MQVGIIGLGLIGGSMGLALRECGKFKKILGFDIDQLHCKQALLLGLVDECVSFEALKQSDVLILATPLNAMIHIIKDLKDIKKDATIIDLGGAKEKIIKSIPKEIRKNFIAAHPMSGTENSGPNAALKGLFYNKIVIIADPLDSGEAQLNLAKDLFVSIGMRIVEMSANEHDKHIALISHMPHVISFALANAVLNQEEPQNILTLIGGGFKDMSRIAKSSPVMWRDIFSQNRENLLDSIDCFENELKKAKDLIKNEKWDELTEWMKKANTLHDFM